MVARIFVGVIVVVVGASAASPPYAQQPLRFQCRNSQNTPLPDLTRGYRGLDVGLYPGKRTTPPDDHRAVGLERARKGIQPLDASGKPSASGRIVLMSMGMSNTASEFGRFVADANGNRAINRRLTILNGAISGADAALWTKPGSYPWKYAISTANGGAHSANQVQVIWLKQSNLKTAPFPAEVEVLKTNIASSLRTAKSVFPNLQIVYLSSRTRAGAESPRGPGEPQAYETAFAVRDLIRDQIERTGNVGVDVVGWLNWGPYLWSNGTPRSDGFVWDCGDVRQDLFHPSASGEQKVAEQLMTFFMTADTSVPWFLEPSLSRGGPRIAAITPSTVNGAAPLKVGFTGDVSAAQEYFWSFEDGTFSRARNPQKTFYLDGTYHVRLTVTDASGRWASSSIEIRVGSPNQKSPALTPVAVQPIIP